MRTKRGSAFWSKLLLVLAILLVGGISLTGCYGRGQPTGWAGAIATDSGTFVGSLDGRLVSLNKTRGDFLWSGEDVGRLGTDEAKVAIYSTPAASGELVYIAGYNGKVYAFVAGNGALRWIYPREGNLEAIVAGLVASQDKVFFGDSDGQFYALDAVTGDRLWTFETGDKIWSTPAVDGDTIYLNSFDDKLYALSTADGTKRWELEMDSTVMTTPAFDETNLYIGSFDRYFYAIDKATGHQQWRSEVEAGKWFWAKPVVHNSVIYAPNLDGKVYLFDAQTGREVTSAIDLGNQISAAAALVDDKVIVATEDGHVYSLDTGSKQSSLLIDLSGNNQKVLAPLSADNGVVYIKVQTASEDTLYAVNVTTQATLWSQPLIISEGD